ncbi:nuclear transport factor 2 family protein [Erythrobacter alti]|uniref:nuclear transport factor 2 family protein n=1 Tax=Erythrobacter alti TaxID=1896145 RepID=UPI0030F372B5
MDEFTTAAVGIGQLHARFVDAVFRQDIREFADCFAEDGVWKIAGQTMAGRDAIFASTGPMLAYCERIQLIAQTPILELTNSGAKGRQQMIELSQMKDGSGAITIGVYHDDYVVEGGRWRFAKRHWSFKYRGPTDLCETFAPTPDYGAFPAGPAEDEETYVRPK